MSGMDQSGTGKTTELRCPRAKQLFSPYLDGAVTGAEMLALQRHLSECEDCERQYEGLRRTQQLLAGIGRP
jgi:predicted anti-sigma-YlaC factor YlaD